MTVMEFINAHREDMDPCECVILPDGSVEEPQPSHIKKLEEISGEDKLTLNSRMEKNMEPIFFMVEYTGCMLIWSTRVVVPSHPTPAQEETLETLHFAAMLAPVIIENRWDRSTRNASEEQKNCTRKGMAKWHLHIFMFIQNIRCWMDPIRSKSMWPESKSWE